MVDTEKGKRQIIFKKKNNFYKYALLHTYLNIVLKRINWSSTSMVRAQMVLIFRFKPLIFTNNI